MVRNAKVCKEDILSHPGIYYNEEFEHDNMFGYDILCRALNRNILSHHALPQNIANMIFVNLLLQKYDKVCFAFTATCKFTSRHTVSHQGMSTSHWGSTPMAHPIWSFSHVVAESALSAQSSFLFVRRFRFSTGYT